MKDGPQIRGMVVQLDPGEPEALEWALEFFLDVTWDDFKDPVESGIDVGMWKKVANLYHALTGNWRINGANFSARPW